jgi:hypothetical protein
MHLTRVDLIHGRAMVDEFTLTVLGENSHDRRVQLFQKVPALKVLAPTQTEPPFAVAQLVVFVLLTIIAAIRFRGEQLRTA